ncbi:hypothetical protein HDU97_004388 [Phlyctochytrium planicorne]|nr:hypothetical protein HDU97_004388 [Phlyctochytrium planicorne]
MRKLSLKDHRKGFSSHSSLSSAAAAPMSSASAMDYHDDDMDDTTAKDSFFFGHHLPSHPSSSSSSSSSSSLSSSSPSNSSSNNKNQKKANRRHSFPEAQYAHASDDVDLVDLIQRPPSANAAETLEREMEMEMEMAYGGMIPGMDGWPLGVDYGMAASVNPLAAAYGMGWFGMNRSPPAGGAGAEGVHARRSRLLQRTQSLSNLAHLGGVGGSSTFFGTPPSPAPSPPFGPGFMMPDAQMIDAAMANPFHPMSPYILNHAAAQLRASAAAGAAAAAAVASASASASAANIATNSTPTPTPTRLGSSSGPSSSEPLSEADLKLLQETRKLVEAQQNPLKNVQSEEEAASIRDQQMVTMVEAPGYAQTLQTKAAITAAAFAVLAPSNGRRSPSQGRSEGTDSPNRSLSRPRGRPVSQSPTRMDSDGESPQQQRSANSVGAIGTGRVGMMGRSRRGSTLRSKPSLTGLDMNAVTAALRNEASRMLDSPASSLADYVGTPATAGTDDDVYSGVFGSAYAAAAASAAFAAATGLADDEATTAVSTSNDDDPEEAGVASSTGSAQETLSRLPTPTQIRRGRKLNRSKVRTKPGTSSNGDNNEAESGPSSSRSSSNAPIDGVRATLAASNNPLGPEVAALLVDNAAIALANGGTPIQTRRRKGQGLPSSVMGIIIPGGRYQCTWPNCGTTFSTSGHLSRHGRIHVNYKPFSCDICGVKFSRSDNMRMHLKTHDIKSGTTSPTPGQQSGDETSQTLFGEPDSIPTSPLSPDYASESPMTASPMASSSYPTPLTTPHHSSAPSSPSRGHSRRSSNGTPSLGRFGHQRKHSTLSMASTISTAADDIEFSEMLMSPGVSDFVDDVMRAAGGGTMSGPFGLGDLDREALDLEMQIFGGIGAGAAGGCGGEEEDRDNDFLMEDLADLEGGHGEDHTMEHETATTLSATATFSKPHSAMVNEEESRSNLFGKLRGFKMFGSSNGSGNGGGNSPLAAGPLKEGPVGALASPMMGFVGFGGVGQDGGAGDFMRSDEIKSRREYH